MLFGLIAFGVTLLMVGTLEGLLRLAVAVAPFQVPSSKGQNSGGVILAVQENGAIQLGVDNLNVARHVGRFLDGDFGVTPLSWLRMAIFFR